MHFLVTGGAGFIGTWVLRELQQRGAPAVVLDIGQPPARWPRVLGPQASAVRLIQGSLLDRTLLGRLLDEEKITHVIHLAALLTPACQQDPWEGFQVNVSGSVALFEAVRQRAGQICGIAYASSVAVFGHEPDHALPAGPGPVAPVEAALPPTFYGAFKKSVEWIADQYWRHFQIPSVGLRPQVVYGPEREVGLTAGPSLAARAAARGEPYTLGYTGRIGYDYVEDVARAFVRSALEAPAGAHVADLEGAPATMEEVMAAIAAAAPGAEKRLSIQGPPLPANLPPRPRYLSGLFPDWQSTSLHEGMRRTVAFYA